MSLERDNLAANPKVWSPSLIVHKAFHGALALGVRQALAQGLNVLGAILLARLLSPSEFGLYAIIVFIRTFLLAFGDVGLGASLIRRPQEPEEDDYRSIFTAQQLLVLSIFILFWIASPLAARLYRLPAQEAWVFRLVDISLIFASFQVIPTIRLERSLAFYKIAIIEVTMALAFNGSAVLLAYLGWGAMSFAWALLLRSVVGAALANIICPWRIRWGMEWKRIREHLRFGIPYQGISFISLLKDSIGPMFIGLLLGAAEMGYVNWANMVAVYPLLILSVLQRLYLPAFARMQAHNDRLGEFVEKAVMATNAVVAPLAILTFVLIRPITLTVFGEKWLVALPLFRLFWLANIFVPTATPVMGLLNSLGRSRTTFCFAAGWMLGTWALGIPLILVLGGVGYALASLLVTLSAPVLFRLAQNQVQFSIVRVVLPAWLVSAAVGLLVWILQAVWPSRSLVTLVCYGTAGLLLCTLAMRKLYSAEIAKLWTYFKENQPSKVVTGAPHAQ